MKKLLKCMVMAVASIGLAFTGCKIDDGGSTPIFWPIGGSGSSSVVAAEIDYDNSYLPEEVIYTQDAKSPKLMVQLANEDKGEWVYKWYKDGYLIEGVDSFVCLPDTSAAAVGGEFYYEVEVFNKLSETVSVKSKKVKVSVQKAVNPTETNAAEVSISGVTNEGVTYTAGDTANAFTVSYSISKDSTHLEGDVSVEWFNENGEKVGDDASYTPVVPATVEGVKIYRYKVVVTNSCPDATGADKIKKAEKDVIIIVQPADMPEDSIYAAPILIDVTGKKEYVAGETASKLTVSSVVTEKKNAKRGTVTYKWYTREDGPVVATGVEYTPDISKYSSISSATAVSIWVEAINDCSATATIEPKIQSSGKKEVKITVKPQATTPVSVVISNKTENSITTGNTKKYSVTVTLSDGTKVNNATWESNDSSIVSVDNDGNVTALKAGTATITATYTAGDVEKNDSVSITVTDAPVNNGNAGISIDFN
ncbi:MAG: Ig-like domain-containing protein [Treponema sp.]|nr:Ig-like domain-containing protein [Treponema sp.]